MAGSLLNSVPKNLSKTANFCASKLLPRLVGLMAPTPAHSIKILSSNLLRSEALFSLMNDFTKPHNVPDLSLTIVAWRDETLPIP